MRCLVVGGTGFLGGAITDELVEAGHDVTVMSRGATTATIRTSAKVLHLDRHGPLASLGEHRFEWVFDTCAYAPDAVRTLLAALGRTVKRYVMISSISAYGTFREPGLSEDRVVPDATQQDFDKAAALSREERSSASAYGESYGPLKRASELAAQDMLGDAATLLRVGLLVGAGDYTDRFTWWVRRIDEAAGERTRVPAPAPSNRPVQFVDVRDAAAFALHCARNGLGGIWNVTSAPMPFGEVLDTIRDVSGSAAEIVWVDDRTMAEVGARPWVDVPLMAPMHPDFAHFLEVGTDKAHAAGLTHRSLPDIVRPLLAWDRSRRDRSLKVGLSEAQEAALLASRTPSSSASPR